MIKSNLRINILNIRKNFSKNSTNINPIKIYSFLKKKKFSFKTIGGYYPSNHEIDDLKILDFFDKKGFIISLPKIKKNNQMDFFQWSKDKPLKINKYGICEPVSSKKICPDVLLIPLVAFDDKLNRLGYGGGYYDRYIEKISKVKKTIKIGLAYSFQKLKKIPVNKYDKKLDVIITEKDFFNENIIFG